MNRNASRAFREIGVENEEACETDDRKRKRKREEEGGGKGGKRMRRGQRGRGNVGVETSGSTDGFLENLRRERASANERRGS